MTKTSLSYLTEDGYKFQGHVPKDLNEKYAPIHFFAGSLAKASR